MSSTFLLSINVTDKVMSAIINGVFVHTSSALILFGVELAL